MKLQALILVIFYLSNFASIKSLEFEQDINGESIFEDDDQDPEDQEEGGEQFFPDETENNGGPRPLDATLTSNFDFPVDVFFDAGGGEHHFMFTIEPSESASMNTFLGHSFLCKRKTNHDEVVFTVIIKSHVKYYSLYPTNSSDAVVKAEGIIGTDFRDHIHPAVTFIDRGRCTAVSARFRSLSSRVLDLWFDDHQGGLAQGTLRMGVDTTSTSYEGHVYFYTLHGDKSKVLGRHVVNKEQTLYLLEDKDYPATKEILDYTAQEVAFMADYWNRTGIQWRSYYGPNGPRPPPVLYMWPAEKIGQVHQVTTPFGQWSCEGPPQHCLTPGNLTLELEVISLQPRAFVIPNFLSAFEAETIISLAQPKLHKSQIGDMEGGGVLDSDTRTSLNTWVSRRENEVTETLYRRAADLLQIDESMLESHTNAEDMQVVHYDPGQKYDAHHDWGVSGYAESRYITLLLYLNDKAHPDAGGETAFPKAAGGRGVRVHPGKGGAVLFYNLLPDGNADDLSLHEATPVVDGEKWLSNFWVWDPKRR